MDAVKRRTATPLMLHISLIILAIAYIPHGWLAIYNGIDWPIYGLHAARSLPEGIWYSWLLISTILSNTQIAACLLSISRNNPVFQNPIIKATAFAGQFSWGFEMGVMFYFWYAWVIGSGLLYLATPNLSFSWKKPFSNGNMN